MSGNPLEQRLELPRRTREKLDAFRRRVWSVKLIEGLGAAAFALTLSYLAVFTFDRFADTPLPVRGALLVIGSLGLLLALPLKCHRWIWRTRRFDQLARLLKHRMPRLSDRMLGIIELAENDLEQRRSAALCQAALAQVDDDLRDKNFDDAVPFPRHRHWIWAAAIPATIAAMALLFVPAAGRNALLRWLLPWQANERYTFAQLEALPASLVVPYAEDFSLEAQLAEQTAWAPRAARAQIGKQPAVSADLAENRYTFPLPAQNQDGTLELAVGDARHAVRVEPKPRPELTELLARIRLPDYLQYPEELTRDARSGTLTVLRGSQTRLLARTTRTLDAATLDGQAQTVAADKIQTAPQPIEEPRSLELSWTDAFGLTAKAPFTLQIETQDDQPPRVICSELARQQVVHVDHVLSFALSADDDFGVKQVGIQWQGVEDPLLNPLPAEGETLLAAGAPQESELAVNATFCAAREGVEPQTLQIRLFATDYLPDRERVYSPPYTLFVLSAEDHSNWLNEQLRRWSRQAQEVYERENQLYETNKELRGLEPGALDTPENRQRLQTQAAAEASNARQLAAVSATGKALIKEAAKNDEFTAATLEGLAEMVNTLDAMAAKRMPSISDLLKKAARARSGKPQDKASDGGSEAPADDAEAPPQVGNNRDDQTADGKPGEAAPQDGKKPTPSISDVESSMNKPTEQDDAEQPEDKPKPGGGSKFGLPSTTVLGGGKPKEKPQQDEEEESAEEILEAAVEEQEALLEAFSKVAEELQRILDNLEGSTFVKRFKAASRRHLRLATDLNDGLAETFGKRPGQLTQQRREGSLEQAETQLLESQNLLTIRQDLEAYYNRVQDGKFRLVIAEMNELNAVSKLETLSELIRDNLHGQSIAHAEYWADTLDRWAEQLVGPGSPESGSKKSSGGGNSLSPEIVLDVMKILEKEIGLREETRSTEQAQDALGRDAYRDRAAGLALTQHEILDMTEKTMTAILDLEKEKDASFPKELELLNHVGGVMREVEAYLREPNTGPETIAAETEIIEMLLQVQRMQPPKKSSKGASGNKPNGGGEGDTEESALALLGRGDEAHAGTVEREISQATGSSGSGYPAEFRDGLDAYFFELEK